MQKKHNRRSVRLREYDYSQNGYYFVTIVTKDRTYLFGEIGDGEMVPNSLGKIIQEYIFKIEEVHDFIRIDCAIVMPNHIHMIIVIDHDRDQCSDVGVGQWPTPTRPRMESKSLGSLVNHFKGAATKYARQCLNIQTVWQRNYYEHIIRSDESLHDIRHYIVHNPLTWYKDQFFVE